MADKETNTVIINEKLILKKKNSIETPDICRTALILSLLLVPLIMGLKISLYSRDEFIRHDFEDAYMGEDKVPDVIWGLTNSMFPVGGGIGALAISYISNIIGRKYSVIICLLLGIAGQLILIISYFSKIFILLVISRLFDGLSSGSIMNVGLCYFFEILPLRYAPICRPLVQLSINFGIFLSSLFSLDSITKGRWIITSIPVILVQMVMVFIMMFLPESPLFIYEKIKNKEITKQILFRLRGENYQKIDEELNIIITDVENKKNMNVVSVMAFLRDKSLAPSILVMSVVQIFQQLSGINAVIYYSNNFLEKTSIKSVDIGSLVIISLCVVGSVISTPIITRFSGRILLLIGYGGMSGSFFIAFTGWMLDAPSEFVLACMCAYVFIFQLGPGPIPWTITMETYLPQQRIAAQGFFTFLNWGANVTVSIVYMVISKQLDFYVALVFGIINLFTLIFLYIFMVDPKGKTNTELISAYQKKIPVFN